MEKINSVYIILGILDKDIYVYDTYNTKLYIAKQDQNLLALRPYKLHDKLPTYDYLKNFKDRVDEDTYNKYLAKEKLKTIKI